MRNASIGYYPSTGYAWMLDEDRKTANQYIHNEHYCSLVPCVWGENHTWDRFTNDVVDTYEANKRTRQDKTRQENVSWLEFWVTNIYRKCYVIAVFHIGI